MNTRQAYYLLRHHSERPSSAGRWLAALLLATTLMGLALIVLGFGAAAAMYTYYSRQLPSAEEIVQRTVSSFATTKIYDRTGTQLL